MPFKNIRISLSSYSFWRWSTFWLHHNTLVWVEELVVVLSSIINSTIIKSNLISFNHLAGLPFRNKKPTSPNDVYRPDPSIDKIVNGNHIN